LLQREPQQPFTNGMKGKVPIWFDNRFGSIEKSRRIKLCSYVARISTLRRGVKLTIPLNPARCHLDMLEQGTMKSLQLVKRDGKYYVHVKAEFQQAEKWEPLKRVRHKRLHVSQYYDRLNAKHVAATSGNCLVVVGYPKGIKYGNFKGNGNARQRRRLARWTYGRMIRYIQEECSKHGIPSEAPIEFWSTRTCHRCGSRHTERLTQSIFRCWNCELIYNADFNSGINIGSRFLPKATTRQATDDLAYAGNEPPTEIVGGESRSPHPFMGGK
jgi:transposase